MIFPGDRQDDLVNLLSNQDAFSRFRTSSPQAIFGTSFVHNIPALRWDTLLATGGTITHLPNESSAQLAVTAASGSRAVLQTRRYFHYDPDKTFLFMGSAAFGTGQANTQKMVGCFDDSDGVFFRQNGTTMQVCVRTSTSGSPVTTAIDQSSWNLDRLNGLGSTSGVNLDFTKGIIYVIDLAWHGYGRVRFGVLIGQKIIYCHQVDNSGTLTSPYMNAYTLPIRSEIVNTAGAAGVMSFKVTSFSISSEGGYHAFNLPGSANLGASRVGSIPTSTTRRPLISIRLKSTFLKCYVSLRSLNVSHGNSADYLLELLIGATLTGAAFASASDAVEFDITATSLTGGTVIASTYQSTAAGGSVLTVPPLTDYYQLARSISGVADIVTIALTSFSLVRNVGACINFNERF